MAGPTCPARCHAVGEIPALAWRNGQDFEDYSDLWRRSADNPAAFWRSLRDYFDTLHDGALFFCSATGWMVWNTLM